MQQLQKLLDRLPGGLSANVVVGIVVLLVVLFVLYRILKSLGRAKPVVQPDLSIDLEALSQSGPPDHGPTLEFYNIPVHMAAIVLAPAGREGAVASEDQVSMVIDQIVPGLEQVFAAHQPLYQSWPAQLSVQGFSNTFFSALVPPNEKKSGASGVLKGTPWCAVAGVFEGFGRRFLAGIVLRAQAPNSHGPIIVQRESQWIDILRVQQENKS